MSGERVAPFARAPDAGLAVENPVGGVLTFKAMSDESGGAMTAIETTAAPGEGPPLHVHHKQDETIYTLEGVFLIKLGEEFVDARSGSLSSSHEGRHIPGEMSVTARPGSLRR